MGTEGRIEMQRLWKGNRYQREESRGKKKRKWKSVQGATKNASGDRQSRMVLRSISDFALDFCTFSVAFFFFFLLSPFSGLAGQMQTKAVCLYLSEYKGFHTRDNRRATSIKCTVNDSFSCNTVPRFRYFKFCKNRLFSIFKRRGKRQGRLYAAYQTMLLLNTLSMCPGVVQVMCPVFKPNLPSVTFS